MNIIKPKQMKSKMSKLSAYNVRKNINKEYLFFINLEYIFSESKSSYKCNRN